MCAHRTRGAEQSGARPNEGQRKDLWEWWPGVGDLRLMGRVKLAIEPSRTDALTAYFRTRVLPASRLNGELTRHSSMPKSGRAELRGIAQLINRVLTIQ